MPRDLHFRATSAAAFEKLGVALGWLGANGSPKIGVDVDAIRSGEFVVKPAIQAIDEKTGDTVIVEEAIVDPMWFFNVRLTHDALVDDGQMSKVLSEFTRTGDTKERASLYPGGDPVSSLEKDTGGGDLIELLPAPAFPKRVWL